MPSATIVAVADTHANSGVHGNTRTERDPGRDVSGDTHSGTDGDTRSPSPGAAHRNPNA
jgi:hypothetical protein